MLLEDQHPHNRHIMIAVLGKPNAGKSTLINHLLGFDLTIVSPKPQTTRNQFHCTFTIDRTEVVLVDTPGVHKSSVEINKRMNHQAQMGSDGVDLNFVLIDLWEKPLQAFKEFKDSCDWPLGKTWIIFTKADEAQKSLEELAQAFAEMKALEPSLEKYFVISAKDGTNIHELTGAIVDAAVPGPHFYPDGSVSNKNERFFVTEYIREQAFRLLKEELPYELAVVIDEYNEKNRESEDASAHISASILVNRPSQRAIVVGRGGTVIKEIGMSARKKIEAMTGGKVHLNLHVKVSPNWFSNNWVLDELGLPRSQTQARVWRKK